MDKKEVLSHWYYFCSLTRQLKLTEQYVDHSINEQGEFANAFTYSNEFAKILMLTSSEFEVIAKAICKESGKKLNRNANIDKVTKTILGEYPNIGLTKIITSYSTIQPLKDWKLKQITDKNGNINEKVIGIEWWVANNHIKHDRMKYFKEANLKNCILSTASLMVLEMYLSKIVLGNLDCFSSYICDYYDNVYAPAYLITEGGEKLPDFY